MMSEAKPESPPGGDGVETSAVARTGLEARAVLGQYRIIAKLGSGGMAEVYLCLAQGAASFDNLVVIKSIRPELADDPAFVSMFLNEARLSARLSHPNVVQTFDIKQEGGQLFIVMDYLEGQPLSSVLNRIGAKRIPEPVKLRVLIDTLAGLHHAHELSDYDGSSLTIVHRDISPQNIFITYEGGVRLLDFGIAKAISSSDATRGKGLKGKYRYMAPEQAQAQPVDRRADIFAVGVVLWELMVGSPISAGASEAMQIAMRVHGKDPHLRDMRPDTAAELADICDCAMAFKPADRYPTAAAMADALMTYADSIGGVATSNEVSELTLREFKADRQQVRDLVSHQVRLVSSTPASAMQVPVLDFSGRRSGTSATQSPPPMSVASLALPASRGGRTLLLAVVASLVALVVAGFWWIQRADRATAALPPAAVNSTPAPGAVAAADVQDARDQAGASTVDSRSPVADAGVSTVSIEISAVPGFAVLELDGALLPQNPFRATVAKDGTVHVVKASAPGYEKTSAAVTYDRDRNVTLALERSREIPRNRMRSSRRGRRGAYRNPSGGSADISPDGSPGDDRTDEIYEEDPYR